MHLVKWRIAKLLGPNVLFIETLHLSAFRLSSITSFFSSVCAVYFMAFRFHYIEICILSSFFVYFIPFAVVYAYFFLLEPFTFSPGLNLVFFPLICIFADYYLKYSFHSL